MLGRVDPGEELSALPAVQGKALGDVMAEPVLTAKQRTAYDLRAQGKTWDEIASAMGCVAQTARRHCERAVELGMQPIMGRMWRRALAPNAGEPTRVARLKDGEGMFDGQKFDPAKFLEMAASAGIPPRVATALGRRIERQFGSVTGAIKKLALAEQVTATTAAAQLVLAHIDEVSIAGMDAKNLAIAYGVLVDKSLLLGGKPTSIVDFNVRQRLTVLMPAMLAEAARRGITMEGTFTREPETVDVDPGQAQENSQLQP